MMPILTRCGYRCDLCLAYKPNIEKNPADRQKLSDGWHKYFGFRIQPSDICCDGCMSIEPKLIDKKCPVRPCVIEKGFENCSQCDKYPCEKIKERFVSLVEIKEKKKIEISEEDYICFIQAYENKRRLDVLRAENKKRQ